MDQACTHVLCRMLGSVDSPWTWDLLCRMFGTGGSLLVSVLICPSRNLLGPCIMPEPRGCFGYTFVHGDEAVRVQGGGVWRPNLALDWQTLPPKQQLKVRCGLGEIVLSTDGMAFVRFVKLFQDRTLPLAWLLLYFLF